MKILYMVPNPPSLVRVRPFNLIRNLRVRGNDIVICTTWSNKWEWQDIEDLRLGGFKVISAHLGIRQIGINLIHALGRGVPLQAEYCWHPDLQSRIADLGKAVDVIHIEHLRGSAYGMRLAAPSPDGTHSTALGPGKKVPIIWDSVDCISHLFEQAAHYQTNRLGRRLLKYELKRTRKYEGRAARCFDTILVTSENDRKALESLVDVRAGSGPGNGADIAVLPNGVDLDYFTPAKDPGMADTIVFSGKMSYHANINAAHYLIHRVMPLVWNARPEVRLIIAGSNPPSSIYALAKRYSPRIEVTGFVSDMRVPLRKGRVAVAPLQYGVGIQNKVLEAMACGIPVVASPLAMAALSVRNGSDCFISSTPEDFSAKIVQLLGDDPMRRAIGEGGRKFVEKNHDWKTITDRLELIYKQAAAAV